MISEKLLSRREFGLVAAVAATSIARPHFAWGAPQLPLRHRGGVSVAGAEFGTERAGFSNRNPGVAGADYLYPQRETIEYFASRGLGLLRLPFRWERIQPRLFHSLDEAELARLHQVVEHAQRCGAVVILDLHNYGRYYLERHGQVQVVKIDELVDSQTPVSRIALADVWRRLAAEFAGNSTVVGLGLMNEPHDMGSADWREISQTVVTAIRQVNTDVQVIVPGDGWSNAHRFAELNGAQAWIQDPANRVVYEAHCYFDADASGKYRRSYASELQDDPALVDRGVRRVRVFLEWCRQNNVAGLIGEIGIPGNDAGWQQVLIGALLELDRTNVSACYWAAGEWWQDYPLSIQPSNNWRDPAPQELALRKFLTH